MPAPLASLAVASLLPALLGAVFEADGPQAEDTDLGSALREQVRIHLGLPEDTRIVPAEGRFEVVLRPGACPSAVDDMEGWKACTTARLDEMAASVREGPLGAWLDVEAASLSCEGLADANPVEAAESAGTAPPAGSVDASPEDGVAADAAHVLEATEAPAATAAEDAEAAGTATCGLVLPPRKGTSLATALPAAPAKPPRPAMPLEPAWDPDDPPVPAGRSVPGEPRAEPQSVPLGPVPWDAMLVLLAGTVAPAAAAVTVGLMPWRRLGGTAPVRTAWAQVVRLGAWLARSAQHALGVAGGLAVSLYSRLADDEILENGTRGQIHGLLEGRPGLSIQEIRAELGVAWGTAVYHLERLERHGLVVSHRHGNHRRYFVAGSREARDRASLAVLQARTAQRLARAIMARPGASQTDLCEEVGVRGPVASKYLRRLERHALVRSETRNRFRCYYPTSPLRDLGPRAWDLDAGPDVAPDAERGGPGPEPDVAAA